MDLAKIKYSSTEVSLTPTAPRVVLNTTETFTEMNTLVEIVAPLFDGSFCKYIWERWSIDGTQKGSIRYEDVYSNDPDSYPENGILADYWYIRVNIPSHVMVPETGGTVTNRIPVHKYITASGDTSGIAKGDYISQYTVSDGYLFGDGSEGTKTSVLTIGDNIMNQFTIPSEDDPTSFEIEYI